MRVLWDVSCYAIGFLIGRWAVLRWREDRQDRQRRRAVRDFEALIGSERPRS